MRGYIHIPFCKQKCSYCKFALTPVFSDFQRKKYIHALCNEIITKISHHNIKQFSTLYFGGGTPSVLPIHEVEKILGLFPKNINEISFESNPEDLYQKYIEKLFSIGINRLSIGIQTLNETSLHEIERQSAKSIFSALESIKNTEVGKVGFFGNRKISINIDFILGLPYGKKGEILENIILLHQKYPFITHTSVYILEKGLYPSHWENITLSDTDIHEEYLQICKYFQKNGWNHYELSNFAKPGYECQHNLGYWNHSEYLGFGLSASEFLHTPKEDFLAIRRNNSPSFSGYYQGQIYEEEYLSNEQLELEKLLFGLRTTGYQINEKSITISLEKCKAYEQQGLLQIGENSIKLTEKGFLFIDHIIENILQ